ncbi:MAG: head-tail connector protein [Candidatus Hamiltonella defensa (Ceratovacuna japonica)]
MLLTLSDIKAQCRLEPEVTDEDGLLALIGRAVEARTQTYLNRRLYASDEVIPEEDPNGLSLTDDIKLGMLLLVSHYYENRSAVSEVDKSPVPMGFEWHVAPYRIIPL